MRIVQKFAWPVFSGYFLLEIWSSKQLCCRLIKKHDGNKKQQDQKASTRERVKAAKGSERVEEQKKTCKRGISFQGQVR